MSGYAVALGMFDAVHIGHRAVLKEVLEDNRQSAVITFDVLPTKKGGSLLTREEKCEKLQSLGVEKITVLEFDKIKNFSPDNFINYILGLQNIKKIVCGFNFRFGHNAEGDTELLRRRCAEKGVEFVAVPEVKFEGETVSTTRIKRLLAEGDIKTVAKLLGEPYSITEKVIEGDKRGRQLGYPTINQKYPEDKAHIRFGVYETEVKLDGNSFKGVTNVGLRPTFAQNFVSAETYIICFNGDCYGKNIKLSFLRFLRDEKRFGSVDELTAAISKDIEDVKKE